jgi:mitochondrial fission protein ELM1
MASPTLLTSRQTAAGRSQRERPYVVELGVRPGVTSSKPPVRIFLGTQDEQDRAERIFFYSIERVRDPARVYQIHVMKNLAGFNRRGWRTGFTNYRFAIPDFGGRAGKAIYNDVDQIYAADPALLFDLDLGPHGYLAVSASDTSVMLLDCAHMAEWWTHGAATSETKEQLLGRVKGQTGLWGRLEAGWNARDMEFVEGQSKLLHYTAMHTQPWHPFPKDYAYRAHPLGEVWYRLERAADAVGYSVFTRQRPSPSYDEVVAEYRLARPASPGPAPMPAAIEKLAATLQVDSVLSLDLVTMAGNWPSQRFDAVVAQDLLEHLPGEDVPWLLAEIFGQATKLVYIAVRCHAADERQLCVREAGWWRERVAAAARQYPNVVWRLDALDRDRRGRVTTVAYQSTLAGVRAATPPRVWVLAGRRAGDRHQLLGLADALGWPYEVKDLVYGPLHHLPNWLLGASLASLDRRRSSQLEAPWPDLIIDGGKRSVPVARWLRARSGEQARWVHVGRSWAPIALFDLLIAAPQYRLPPRPNLLPLAAPLHRITSERLADAAVAWKDRLGHLPRPWYALLVGGNSPPYRLDAGAARRLAEEVNAIVQRSGGSVLVTTSARTRSDVADALFGALTVPAYKYRWRADAPENPYLGFLALADSVIVTGDSASMLAEACATGKPVATFEVPRRPSVVGRLLAAVERLLTGHGSRKNYRGMPKQQDWLARSFDRLVERGLFMPLRDLRECHRELMARNLLHRLGDNPPPGRGDAGDDMERAVGRVRALMAGDRRVE